MSGDSIRVRGGILEKIEKLARNDPTRECCGLMAGCDGLIVAIFPATNAAANPSTNYEIAPEEIFRAVRAIRDAGYELMGIYHSHPKSQNEPSARDIEQAYYPDVAYFIVSPQPGALRPVRAFSIREGRVDELAIQILQGDQIR